MNSKKQYPEWSEEAFGQQPKLVILFDRMARMGRAMMAARARVAQAQVQGDNGRQKSEG